MARLGLMLLMFWLVAANCLAATRTWTGNTDRSLSNAANWDTLPASSDTALIPVVAAGKSPTSGTCSAGTVTLTSHASIDGGVWTGGGTLTITSGSGPITLITAGTFSMPIGQGSGPYCEIDGGVYNGPVTLLYYGQIYGGTFTANVACAQSCYIAPSVGVPTFNADLMVNTGGHIYNGIVINKRLSMDGGSTWLYKPTADTVAVNILSGKIINGVTGTYVVPVQVGYSALAAGYGAGGTVSGSLSAGKIMDVTYGTLATSSVLASAGGSYTVPLQNSYLNTASGYGAGGTTSGLLTLPVGSNVRYGVTYGVSGSGSTGAYVRPPAIRGNQ